MSEGRGIFRSRLLAVLVGLTIVSGLGLVALVAFGSSFLDPATAGADSFSASAVGFRGAYAFLEASGIAVSRVRDGRLPHVDAKAVLVITDPEGLEEDEPDFGDGALEQILESARDRGATIVAVLPKWRSTSNGRWSAGAFRVPLNDVQAAAARLLDLDSGDRTGLVHQVGDDVDGVATSSSGKVFQVRLRKPQILPAGGRFEPLLSIRQGILAGIAHGDGGHTPLIVIADPDLLNNHGLDDAEHAAALLDLVRQGLHADAVAFEESLHGFEDSGRLLRQAFEPPIVLVTAHLALAIALALWAGSSRFGPPRAARPRRALSREAFIDSTVRLLGGTKDEVSSLDAYWRLAQEAVADDLRLPPLPPPERLRRLAEASAARRATQDPLSLESEISTAVQFETDSRRWVALAERVHLWRREMTGGLRTTS